MSAVSADGGAIWVSGFGWTNGGVRVVVPGLTPPGTSADVTGVRWGEPGYDAFQTVALYNGQLWGASTAADGAQWGGVFTIGSGLPLGPAVSAPSGFPSGVSASIVPGQFTFENDTALWVADSASATLYSRVNNVSGGGGGPLLWSRAASVAFTSAAAVNGGARLWALCGRNESTGAGGGVAFALYATFNTGVYRFVSSVSAPSLAPTLLPLFGPSVIASALPGSSFRGVAFAPLAPGVRLGLTRRVPLAHFDGLPVGTAAATITLPFVFALHRTHALKRCGVQRLPPLRAAAAAGGRGHGAVICRRCNRCGRG